MGIVEIVTAIVSVGAIGIPLTWLWKRQNIMLAELQNRYSKEETHEIIDLKQKPIQESLDRNTKVTEELTKVLTELRIQIAEERGYGKGKSGSGSDSEKM